MARLLSGPSTNSGPIAPRGLSGRPGETRKRGRGDVAAGRECSAELDRADLAGARTLGIGLDLERDVLAADEALELEGRLDGAPVEEVLIAVSGGYEAEIRGRRPPS